MAKEKILNSLKSHILVFIRKVLKISILTIPFGVGGFYVKKKKSTLWDKTYRKIKFSCSRSLICYESEK